MAVETSTSTFPIKTSPLYTIVPGIINPCSFIFE